MSSRRARHGRGWSTADYAACAAATLALLLMGVLGFLLWLYG